MGFLMGFFIVFGIWALTTLFVSAMFAAATPVEQATKEYINRQTLVIAIILGVFYFFLFNASIEREKINAIERQEWVSNNCPMYQSQCGSKNPFACELKAAKVGRNMVGNIAVTAYKTCESKP